MTDALEPSSNCGVFLDAAARIGARLVREALWDGDVCTWQVMAPNRKNPRVRVAVPEIAGGAVYQGSAGIALFLAELYRLTNDVDARRTAIGAARHAAAQALEASFPRIGFHNGRVGVAYAIARTGMVADQPRLLAAADALVATVEGHEQEDRSFDVIGGAAGAILALQHLSAWLADDQPRRIALSLGEHLIRMARLEPVGWSWGGSTSAVVRNLTGYAHGAAGIGHAFTELYRTTGSAAFRYAAEQAFAYERQFFDPSSDNWPDFRHEALGRYAYEGRMDELAQRIRDGEPPPAHRPSSMTAWCHGAPGIGLSRLCAFDVFRDSAYQLESRAALRATVRSLSRVGSNYSLCHGLAGNCETLLLASDLADEPALRHRAELVALHGLEQFASSDRGWPCGTLGAVRDPSLMLGEAGIGHFLLRLCDRQVLSVLALAVPGAAPPNEVDLDRRTVLRDRHVRAYFGRTLQAIERILGSPASRMAVAPEDDDHVVASALVAIHTTIGSERDPERRAQLHDCFTLDEACYELAHLIADFTEPLLRDLARPMNDQPLPLERLYKLRTTSRLVIVRHDWQSWLSEGQERHTPAPVPTSSTFLAYRHGNRIAVRRLGAFTRAVLECFRSAKTASDALEQMADALSIPALNHHQDLERMTCEQIAQALHADVLEVARADVIPIPAALHSAVGSSISPAGRNTVGRPGSV